MKHQQAPIEPQRNRGFTLLEIMIAILIISIGLTALATLQGKLLGYSTIAKQRTLAMNLAEQQIETMQSFYTMADTGVDACTAAQTGYDDLETCSVGTTLSAGNMQFTSTWTVASYVQNADGTTEVFTSESGNLRADLKLVTIKVAWVDGEGVSKDIKLSDIVDATSIFNTGRVSARVDSNIPPRVPFDADDFPGVVEIALGNDKIKGSTTPKPQIVNQGNNVITSFDVVTFMATGNDAYLQRREEFKVLNCICSMDVGTDTGREPTVWDGTEYALGNLVSKRTGSVSANESGQPSQCETCCNDHHDASGASVAYDNFRPAFTGDAGTFNFLGDHAHYQIVDGTKVVAAEGDDYLEACRFIRKDGLFKLTTDLSLENLDVMRESYPVTFNSSYSTSVIGFVTDFSEQINVETYPGVVPDGTYSPAWWLEWWGIFLGNVGVIQPAASRGIYVDYITSDLLKKIKCLQADGSGTYAAFCDTLKDPSWMELLPFFDVDLTSLANWNKGSASIIVSNSPISDIDSSSFSRGEVEIAQDHWDVVTTVSGNIEHSNTGLTDTNPVDPDDELEDTEDITVQVVIGGTPPAAGVLILGNIDAGSNQINVETVRVAQDPPDISCEIITIVDGQSTQKTYICDLSPSPSSGSVSFTDYNAEKVLPSSTTVLNRKVCVDSAAYATMVVYDDGVMADPDMGVTGERTVLTFSSVAVDTTINITIEEEADSCP